MSKPLDLNKSVYELTEQYPELIDIMKELGFSEIVNPAMRQSMGRVMTIPKGAKVKKISMIDVVTTLMQNGFQLEGKMPPMAKMFMGKSKKGTSAESVGNADARNVGEADESNTTEALKGYLKRLGKGEDLESVRADFAKNFSSVEASEIMKAEQELMQEGTPLEEVQQLCDVHSALFHGATREEQIANAEKEVVASIRRVESKEREEQIANHTAAIRAQKNQEATALKAIPGHPLRTFSRVNDEIESLIDQLKTGLEEGKAAQLSLNELRHLATHYAMKGDLLYPVLKVRYDVTGPSQVMWTVDDEIRHEITALGKEENRDASWVERFYAVLTRAEEMIYKEENILFPICALNFSEAEWMGIYQDAKDYDAPFGIEETWEEAENAQAKIESSMESGEVVMPGGHMTIPQLTALLNTLPVEITFIDDQNINRYFNEGPKVFKRPSMALDREVFSCHPPKIEPMVRSILDSFRNGTQDSVPVWMEKEGKTLLVTYMAVRDRKQNYLGTVEVVQDMSAAKEYFANQE